MQSARAWRALATCLAAGVAGLLGQLWVTGPSQAMPQEFSIPILDGKAALTGQVDVAEGAPPRIVILVAGTGAFGRDVKLGRSGTDADLVFLDLAKRLNAAGVTTVRYDKRGVTCAPGGAACLDLAVLATANAASGPQDLAAVYGWAKSWRPNACLGVLAHSEGMLQAAHAIEEGYISPAALFGIGGLMESPATVFRWQRIDRIPDSLRQADHDKDGITTNAEIARFGPSAPFAVFGDVKMFASATGQYDEAGVEAVRKAWADYYVVERQDALDADPASPFLIGGQIAASYDWWRQWFTDETPVAARLKGFKGPIRLYYGDIDSQTPASRQAQAIDSELPGRDVVRREFGGLGHTLGRDVFMGPMDPDAADAVASDVAKILLTTCPRSARP